MASVAPASSTMAIAMVPLLRFAEEDQIARRVVRGSSPASAGEGDREAVEGAGSRHHLNARFGASVASLRP